MLQNVTCRPISLQKLWYLGLILAALFGGGCSSSTVLPTATHTPSPTLTPLPTATHRATPTQTLTPAATPTDTASVTTITVWENLSDAQRQLLLKDVEQFQTEFPQYRINLKQYTTPEDFITPLLVGRVDFDVVLASPILLNSLRNAKQIAPMSDFFPPSFIDAFAAITLAGATQENILWGLPDIAGFHLLLFYNQALVDTPPTTTTELFDLAQELTDDAQWGLGVNSYDPLWLIPWLNAGDSWIVDESGQPTLDTPAMESTLALYQSWLDSQSGIAPIESYDDIRRRFQNGTTAMMIDGEWAIKELENADDILWGVALLPDVGQPDDSQPAAPLVLSRYWAISQSATGDRTAASTTFLEFITQPERQLAWTEQFGFLPTRREALEDPAIVNDPLLRISATQMQAGRAVPLGVNINTLLDAMRGPLQSVIDGELSPQEAAELMQKNVER